VKCRLVCPVHRLGLEGIGPVMIEVIEDKTEVNIDKVVVKIDVIVMCCQSQ